MNVAPSKQMTKEIARSHRSGSEGSLTDLTLQGRYLAGLALEPSRSGREARQRVRATICPAQRPTPRRVQPEAGAAAQRRCLDSMAGLGEQIPRSKSHLFRLVRPQLPAVRPSPPHFGIGILGLQFLETLSYLGDGQAGRDRRQRLRFGRRQLRGSRRITGAGFDDLPSAS